MVKLEGTERSYLLYLPADLPQGAPILFYLHGYNGKGLRVVGRTKDGIVEMMESIPESKQDIIGVQFHPEIFARKGKQPYLEFFKDLVRRSEVYRQ